MHDSGGTPRRPGPFLAPVARNASTLEEAVDALLGGLTVGEMELGITNAIPPATILNDVEVDGDIATVDLSGAFDDGGGTFSMGARLAQLVFTVTGFDPDLVGVRLELDGSPVEVFSSEGVILDDPMTRAGYEAFTPGILIETPPFDAWAPPPLTIEGIAAAFEGVFQLEILDSGGTVVAEVPFMQTDNGVGWGSFSVTFDPADLPLMPADLFIRVYELSAEDGSVINERIQPVGYRLSP